MGLSALLLSLIVMHHMFGADNKGAKCLAAYNELEKTSRFHLAHPTAGLLKKSKVDTSTGEEYFLFKIKENPKNDLYTLYLGRNSLQYKYTYKTNEKNSSIENDKTTNVKEGRNSTGKRTFLKTETALNVPELNRLVAGMYTDPITGQKFSRLKYFVLSQKYACKDLSELPKQACLSLYHFHCTDKEHMLDLQKQPNLAAALAYVKEKMPENSTVVIDLEKWLKVNNVPILDPPLLLKVKESAKTFLASIKP